MKVPVTDSNIVGESRSIFHLVWSQYTFPFYYTEEVKALTQAWDIGALRAKKNYGDGLSIQ